MTSSASGVDLSPNSTRSPALSPLNSSVDAAMNGISIFSSMRPTIGSWSRTTTGRVAWSDDGGGWRPTITPVPW